MTCIRIPNGIICVNPWGRVRLGNRYVWIDFHTYCGPTFWWTSAMTKEYMPVGENDPIWPEFAKWQKKYEAQKAKASAGTCGTPDLTDVLGAPPHQHRVLRG